MNKEMIVKAMCAREKQHFAIQFVQSPQGWGAEKTFKLSAERAEKGYNPDVLSNIYLAANYAGCPYCNNKSFFLCGCKLLNCQGSARTEGNRTHVTCAHCGHGGFLEGQIEQLSGHGDV